jgi:hypothetical protein
MHIKNSKERKKETHAMIFKSFLLSSINFSMRLINLVFVVGLYHGFLTTFSIDPS